MTERPNIVLIQVDQWRGDCLSVAGHPVAHTPTLDALALDGVRFARAYSSTPICIPARSALMTGLSARSHGRVGYEDGVPWNYRTTLGGEFTRHGFQTEAVGKLHAFPERSRLGFEHVVLHDGYGLAWRRRNRDLGDVDDYLPWLRAQTSRTEADDFEHGIHCNSHVARPWPLAEHLHPTNWVTMHGIDFLRRRDSTRPFFLYLSYHRPHPPYDPPAWAFEQFIGTEMPPPPVGDWVDRFEGLENPFCANTARGRLRPDILQRARAGYYGHLSHIDQQINRFLWALRERDLWKNTWICFTSDHGELLGDHHFFHKSLPYEGSARVPLLLRGPAGAKMPAGIVNDAVVEQRDILPTLLAAAGLPAPAGIDGHSLLGCARNPDASVRDYLHGETATHGGSVQWLTDGREKYVWFSADGHEQLFDLRVDPQELNDLNRTSDPTVPTRLGAWRTRLIEALAGSEEGFVRDGVLVAGRSVKTTLSHVRTGSEAVTPA